jgi:hypothetical protein
VSPTTAWLFVAAAAACLLGPFLPWVKVTGPFGLSAEVTGTDGGRDGWVFVVGGIVLAILAVRCLQGAVLPKGWAIAVAIGAGLLILLGVWDLSDVNDRIDEARLVSEGLVDAEAASGLYLSIGGAILGLIAALTSLSRTP